jgi:hypothetical protein
MFIKRASSSNRYINIALAKEIVINFSKSLASFNPDTYEINLNYSDGTRSIIFSDVSEEVVIAELDSMMKAYAAGDKLYCMSK